MPRRTAILAGLFALSSVVPLRPSGAQVPVGGWASPNVEWLGNVTLSGTTGAITGVLHRDHFYAEGLEAVEIFDVSDPLAPTSVSRVSFRPRDLLPSETGAPDLGRHDIDTNGRVLVLSWTDPNAEIQTLQVYDISDKASPRLLGRLDDAGWSFTCIASCRWAYAATGQIVDLRDTSNPKLAGNWAEGLSFSVSPTQSAGSSDVTQVAPGRVLTASAPMYLLDVTRPASPRVLAKSDGSPHTRGTVIWPNMAANTIALSVSQSFMMPRCELQEVLSGSSFDSAFKTWKTSGWRSTGLITGGSEYRLRNGTYVDGNPPVSGGVPFFWGCGSLEVDADPRFRDGGLVVIAGSGHGVKFLEVDRKGGIEEVGWFLPYANDTFGAYWITDEIVYTVDWPRGIDILRFDPNA